MTLLLGLATIAGGVAVLIANARAGRAVPEPTAWLAAVGMAPEAPPASGPIDQIRRRLAPFLPTTYVERLARRIEIAGQGRALTAEEVATAQVIFGTTGVAVAVGFATMLGTPFVVTFGLVALFGGIGVLGPSAWVSRAARERQDIVRRDLPDVLDLLAISVEAGLGFEASLDLAARNFSGPLADELRRALREMELGASRHEALQSLKRRVDVPELSTFVLALTQADALGMPIGRVLHAQAADLRMRRRQWAREKAGKMPIKILFPLVFLIFPSIMVILLGPAAISIMKALG